MNDLQILKRANNGTDEINNVDADTSIPRLWSTLIFSTVYGAVTFTVFLILAWLYTKWYQPRKDRWFKTSWMWRLIVTTDAGIIKSRGPDCVVYLRLVRTCLYITGVMLIGFVVLMIINDHGPNKDLPKDKPSKTAGLDVYTMSNLGTDDPYMWAHLVAAWLFSFGVYLAVYFNTTRYLSDKQKWLSRCTVREFTVLFQDLREDQSTGPQMTKWCEKWYPASVVSCNLVRTTPKLDEDRKLYLEYRDKLEGAAYELSKSKKGARPTTRAGGYLWGYVGGTKVDAIDYYVQQMREIKARIEAALSCPIEMYPATGSGLVTFDNTFIARAHHFPTIAPPLSSLSPKSCTASSGVSAGPAPEPNDVLWDNMHISAFSRTARGIGVFVLLALLVCFWGIPVAFVTGITQLENLSRLPGGSFLEDILDISSFVRGLVEGYLPPLVLTILAHLPIYIIKFLVSLIGVPAASKQQKWVFNAYYYFMLLNVLLIGSLAGGAFAVLDEMIDHPASIADRLAQTLPKQSTYFICFLIIKGGALPMELLRLVDWLKYMFKLHVLAKTPRQKLKLLDPGPYYYATHAAVHLFILTITLLFSVMAPLVIVFGFTYFLIAYYIDKYSMIFVYKKQWEAGGFIWDAAVPQFFVATLLFQVTMIGLFGLYQFYPGAIVMAPLLPASLVMWYMCLRLIRRARYGPIEDDRDPYLEIDGEDVDDDDDSEGLEDDYPQNGGRLVSDHGGKWREKEEEEEAAAKAGKEKDVEGGNAGESDELLRRNRIRNRKQNRRKTWDAAAEAEADWKRQRLGNAYVQPALRPLFAALNQQVEVDDIVNTTHDQGAGGGGGGLSRASTQEYPSNLDDKYVERSPRTHHLQGLAEHSAIPSSGV
eukprot:TRINITY_DN5073_c0_g1_i1.p1 TRINITY_DN5073_c0_g1~~TRINITY_DN5073_c0_g1_i1.p1  ORF type:complete len:875 (-),score=121.99 TRINITY_DN5073_c0_g1_i1:51-2675(-)